MKLISCAALLLIAIPSAQSWVGKTIVPYSGWEEVYMEKYNPEQLELGVEAFGETYAEHMETDGKGPDDPHFGHVGGKRLTKPNAASEPMIVWGKKHCAKDWGDEVITKDEAAKIALSHGLKLGGGGYEFAGNASVHGPYKEYGLFWYKEGEYAGSAFFGVFDNKGKNWYPMRIEQQKSPTTEDRFRLPERCVACFPGDFMKSGYCIGKKIDRQELCERNFEPLTATGWTLSNTDSESKKFLLYKTFMKKKVTFNQAQLNCKALGYGASLAEIHSQAEQNLLISSYEGKGKIHWIGARRVNGKTFAWEQEKTPMTFENWDKGRHYRSGNKGDCVCLYEFYGDMKWNDYRCNDFLRYACQIRIQC